MKKNKMMRLASVLMVAVLLTTSVISGTYAKYVTKGTSTDSANVAKWGVVVEENSTTMFAKEYYNSDGNLTVETLGEGEVFAPGTSGSLTKFNVTGEPEVAGKITFDLEEITFNNWVDGYYPIVFVVGEQRIGIRGSLGDAVQLTQEANDYADLLARVKHEVQQASIPFKPNQNLSQLDTTTALNVSWEWPFETGHDDLDTKLGDNAANFAMPSMSVKVSATVTQVD